MPLSEVSQSELSAFPYSAVGVVVAVFPDNSWLASTVAVVGRNDILTSTSALFQASNGGWAKDLRFYFGADYDSLNNEFDSSNFTYRLESGTFTYQGWGWPSQSTGSNPFTAAKYDVAIVGVGLPLGDVTGWFGLAKGFNDPGAVRQIGYSSNSTGLMTSLINVQHSDSPSFLTSQELLDYEYYFSSEDLLFDTGGPLVTEENYIIGVKSETFSTVGRWADIGYLYDQILDIMEINDSMIQFPLTIPSLSVQSNASSVNEGSLATFTVFTENVGGGTELDYLITGVDSADIVGGSLGGKVVISGSGIGTITIPLSADETTEGTETLQVWILNETASLSVLDTSANDKGPTDSDRVYVFKSEEIGPGINPASLGFFYTANNDEADLIRSNTTWPWVQRDSTFEAAHSNPEESVPLHRFWSDKHQSHFYTVSEEERQLVIDKSASGVDGFDWAYEGIAFGVYLNPSLTDADGNSVIPVYRLWMDDKDFDPSNGYSGGHYYTADYDDYNSQLTLVGVRGEGIAFYGEPLG